MPTENCITGDSLDATVRGGASVTSSRTLLGLARLGALSSETRVGCRRSRTTVASTVASTEFLGGDDDVYPALSVGDGHRRRAFRLDSKSHAGWIHRHSSFPVPLLLLLLWMCPSRARIL